MQDVSQAKGGMNKAPGYLMAYTQAHLITAGRCIIATKIITRDLYYKKAGFMPTSFHGAVGIVACND
jgi:hypothetical protein